MAKFDWYFRHAQPALAILLIAYRPLHVQMIPVSKENREKDGEHWTSQLSYYDKHWMENMFDILPLKLDLYFWLCLSFSTFLECF